MIQVFHTSWPELWLNPRVGQPPALWYSVAAEMGTMRVTPTAGAAVLILNRRLAWICLIRTYVVFPSSIMWLTCDDARDWGGGFWLRESDRDG